MHEILADPERWGEPLNDSFADHGLLYWRDQVLSPADEVRFMKLLDWDRSAAPEQLYGPLGKPGVDAERIMRWRIPGQREVLLQGEGKVSDHHGLNGDLNSGKPVKEWHSDGCHEQATPSVATSMYSISNKEYGGATLFMSGVQIYDNLTDADKGLVGRMFAQYSRTPQPMRENGYRAASCGQLDIDSDLGGMYEGADLQHRKPDGYRHPIAWRIRSANVEKVAIIVSPMWVYHLIEVQRIDGKEVTREWSAEESQAFIERLLSHGKRSEYAHEWTPGDFVVWDNRQLLHSASPNDTFSDQGTRLLHRVRLKGTQRPEGPGS